MGETSTLFLGGNPTQRRRGGSNKVNTGGGRGNLGGGNVGAATSAWLSGGGMGGVGGGPRQEPLPAGPVLSGRERAVLALDVPKEILGDEVGNLEELIRGKLPPEKAPTPPPSPTEQQRAERFLTPL